MNPFNQRAMKLREAFGARHEPEARTLLARAYWSFLIILFASMAVAAVVYGAWEFTRPLEAKSDIVVGTPKTTLNRADLQKVLDGFDARADRFEERRRVPASRDPS